MDHHSHLPENVGIDLKAWIIAVHDCNVIVKNNDKIERRGEANQEHQVQKPKLKCSRQAAQQSNIDQCRAANSNEQNVGKANEEHEERARLFQRDQREARREAKKGDASKNVRGPQVLRNKVNTEIQSVRY
jgi:hypothetical protein